MRDKQVVLIAGTGHCGSTLLDLILSSHSNAFGLGELWSLGNNERYFQRELPFCNINGFEDLFWTKERTKHIYKYFRKKSRIGKFLMRLMHRKSGKAELFQYLFQETNALMLIDSSKNANWINKCLTELSDSNIEPVLIYLTRDGRAVINSYYKKYPDRGLEKIIDQWLSKIERFKDLYHRFGGTKTIISYEEFTSDPKNTIKKLCDLICLEFQQDMMEFWKHDHHQIGGNTGTKSMILKYKKDNVTINNLLDSRKKEYYKGHPLEIIPDFRWKEELNDSDLKYIESRISELNLHYGFQ